MAPQTRHPLERHGALLAGLVGLAVVLPTLTFPPILDDSWAVLDNPLVQNLSNVGRIFHEPYGFAGGSTLGGPFRPITTLSFALNYALHGRSPAGYHLVNALLHALSSALVVVLARRLLEAAKVARAELGALAAGLLFAVHPVHVEALAPIVGRTDLLASCLALAALRLALEPGWRWKVGATAVLAVGVLSKESAAVMPALYFLVALTVPAAAGLAVAPDVRTGAGRRVLAQVVVVSLAMGLSLVPYFVLRGGAVAPPPASRWFPPSTPTVTVVSAATRVAFEYLRMIALPSFLGTDFAYAARIPPSTQLGAAEGVATLGWMAALGVAVWAFRRRPFLSLAVTWGYAALLPVLHFIPIGVLIAERLAYLPTVGFCVLVGLWVAQSREGSLHRLTRPAFVAVSLAALAVPTARMATRLYDWRTPLALWEAELPKAPRDVVLNNNLGLEYTATGDFARAKERLQTAIAVAPGYWRAHVNLGIVYQRLGDFMAAERSLLEALRLEPSSGTPVLFLALNRSYLGDLAGAVTWAQQGERIAPEDTRLPRYAGEWLSRLGRTEEARAELQKAVRIDPANLEAKLLLEKLPAP